MKIATSLAASKAAYASNPARKRVAVQAAYASNLATKRPAVQAVYASTPASKGDTASAGCICYQYSSKESYMYIKGCLC